MKTMPKTLLATLAAMVMVALAAAQDMPRFRWENFTTAEGLPSNVSKVNPICFCKACNRARTMGQNGQLKKL